MKFSKLNQPNKIANVIVSKYKIDWNRKVSAPQLKVKKFLQPFWESCEVLEEFLIPGSKLRIDIVNLTLRVCVEISPSSSHKFNPFFHKSEVTGFLSSLKRDDAKRVWCEQNNYILLELGDEELKSLTKKMFLEKFSFEF